MTRFYYELPTDQKFFPGFRKNLILERLNIDR